MKTRLIYWLLMPIVYSSVSAQTDTLTLTYRDKEVMLESDSEGVGKKEVVFFDGVKSMKVTVEFDAEAQTEIVEETQTTWVRKHPTLKYKSKKPIYYTLSVRNGIVSTQNLSLMPETSYDYPSVRNWYGNEFLSSRSHDVRLGLDIPTNIRFLTLQTGLGISTQRIQYAGTQFTYNYGDPGYNYVDSKIYKDWYQQNDHQNTFIYKTSLTVPLNAKVNMGKKGWYSTLGVAANVLMVANQRISEVDEKSILGIRYFRDPVTFNNRIGENFSRLLIDGEAGIGNGIIGIYASANLNSLFSKKFYSSEPSSSSGYDLNKWDMKLWKLGLQFNIL